MKQNQVTKSLAMLLLAASTSSLTAIERPVPAEQPKEKTTPAPMPQVEEAQAKDIAYLGVMGDSITEAMSAQLNLNKNVGLTLLFVEQNSPAGKAGLKRHDIITKLGRDNIGDQNQLRAAILKYKPHDQVNLNYISGGKELTKKIKLGAAPNQPAQLQKLENGDFLPIPPKGNANLGGLRLEMLDNLPPEQREQLQQLLKGNLNKLDFRNLNNLDVDQLQKHFQQFGQMNKLELNLGDLLQQGDGGALKKGRMKMMDGDGSVTLETEGNNKSIELHDQEGNLLYKGPYNDDADKLKIPENLRKRASLLRLKKMPRAKILPNIEGLKELGKLKGFKVEGLEGLKQLENMKMPKELQDLLKNLQAGEEGMNLLQIPQAGKLGKIAPQMQQFKFQLGADGLNNHSSKSLTGPDGNHYTKSQNKDGKEVEVKGPKGELLYSGPYNSSVDKEMVPEEYRPSLERLEAMGQMRGLKLKIEPR